MAIRIHAAVLVLCFSICGQLAGEAAPPSGSDALVPSAESDARQKLVEAREALTGKAKKTALARQILSDLAEHRASDLEPTDRCYLYVYLGYLEDLAGRREGAIGWYRRALPLEGPRIEGVRGVAELGMTKPITWIRHLDSHRKPPRGDRGKPAVVQRIGGAVLTSEQPLDLAEPRMNLSKEERRENFEVLCEVIDRSYSFFDHKDIDWPEVCARYRSRVEAVETDADYYRLLYDLVGELKDAHSWLQNYRQNVLLPKHSPPLATRRVEGKAVVTEVDEDSEPFALGLRRGSIIDQVDGLPPLQKVEQLRPVLFTCSSERAFLARAYWRLLHGERDSTVRVTFRPQPGDDPVTVELKRTDPAMWATHRPTFPVEKGKSVWSGVHPSGYGYIRILSFVARDELADEFDRALEKLRDTPALVIDVRDNPGGSGQSQRTIVGRFITARTLVNTGGQKNGPGHDDFREHSTYFEPKGGWQYTRPIALLTNAITGSATDLFVCRLTSTGRPIHLGTTSHGNLSGVSVYATLPCGLVVRVSTGYVANSDGRVIEVNGTEPQIRAEPTIDDVIAGTDSVLDRAVGALRDVKPWNS